MECLEGAVREALSMLPEAAIGRIAAVSVDTAGSTPVAVNRQGTPLALTERFEENPNALFLLWKGYTAVKEAAEINAL